MKDQILAGPLPSEVKRMEECPARTARKECLLLNMKLGWSNLLPLEKCDVCWKLGGPGSEPAMDFLDLEKRRTVEWASKPENAKRLPREVLVPLTVKHMTPEQAQRIEPHIQVVMLRPTRWPEVHESWKKATSFALSLGSKVLGPLPSEKLAERRQSCATCPARDGDEELKVAYCGVCGCGRKKRARLDRKLEYPHLKCPLRRKGFSNEEP